MLHCPKLSLRLLSDTCGTVTESITFEQLAKAFKGKPSQKDGQGNTLAYAAHDKSGHLVPFSFDRRALRDDDVHLQITHCGICHSDLHQIKNEWQNAMYPMVPGQASQKKNCLHSNSCSISICFQCMYTYAFNALVWQSHDDCNK